MKPPFGHSSAAPAKGTPFAALRKGGKAKKAAKGKLAPPFAKPMMPEPDMDQMGGPSDKDADNK